MEWWMWAIGGLALIAGEMMMPGGFFLMFFGIAALIVSMLVLIGLSEPTWLPWALFSGLAVVLIALLRKRLVHGGAAAAPSPDRDTMSGMTGVSLTATAPGERGKVEVRGASWSSLNVGNAPIGQGAAITVVRAVGLTLEVRAS
jgi:membrane protein implicated in regulation of membrane protease activity